MMCGKGQGRDGDNGRARARAQMLDENIDMKPLVSKVRKVRIGLLFDCGIVFCDSCTSDVA